jgi:hypothetical protein
MNVSDRNRETMKNSLFREPRGGKLHWVTIGVGTISVVLSLSGWFGGQATFFYLFLGLFVGLFGAAEVLPKTRTQAAGILRISALISMILLGMTGLTLIATAG